MLVGIVLQWARPPNVEGIEHIRYEVVRYYLEGQRQRTRYLGRHTHTYDAVF